MSGKRLVRGVLAALVGILVLALVLEAFLWFVDPLGIATYVSDLSSLVTIANAEGYTLAPGEHHMRYWTYTIEADGSRVMPEASADCTIAFVGDSIAFGLGVSDQQPFPYLFAQEYPDVLFVNEAKIAYNIGNVRYAVEHYPADGYIYFMADNDQNAPWARPDSDYGQPRDLPPRLSAIRYYISTFQEMDAPVSINNMEGFWLDFAALQARDDVMIDAMASPLAESGCRAVSRSESYSEVVGTAKSKLDRLASES